MLAGGYPWSDYAVERDDDGIEAVQMHLIQMRFRRIVSSLRSDGKGSLARFRDKIEHRRVLKNEMGRALLNQLLGDGIMKLDGKFYHWVADRAGAVLKVSWNDLRRHRSTPELKKYLEQFIEGNSTLFDAK